MKPIVKQNENGIFIVKTKVIQFTLIRIIGILLHSFLNSLLEINAMLLLDMFFVYLINKNFCLKILTKLNDLRFCGKNKKKAQKRLAHI